MDKPDPGSAPDKDAKEPPATKAEAGGAGDVVSATGRVSSGMVRGVTNVATDLVVGAGMVADEAVTVVRDTANSAIVGVGSIGETAVHTVTGLLADLIGGLRDIGSTAVRGRTVAGTEGESRGEEARRREAAAH